MFLMSFCRLSLDDPGTTSFPMEMLTSHRDPFLVPDLMLEIDRREWTCGMRVIG